VTVFDIFDTHHHVGDPFGALGGAVDGGAPNAEEHQRVELERRLQIMDEGGVRQAAVIPGHGYLRPNGLADTRAVNDRIAAYRDNMPDRFPVAVGIIEPRDGPLGLEELERVHDELGLAGISFHTRFQGVSLDSKWVARYVGRMAELGMVPVVHAMNETPDEALWKLAQLARTFPDVAMLALDGFCSYEGTREIFHVAEVAPNLLFDTSLSYNFDFIEDFAKQFGAERVVFGTDLYSPPVGRRISHLLPQILECTLDDDAKARILGGNARALFGVEK
jgi:predicted TIM-barrel fold metal-dependent hydrolase